MYKELIRNGINHGLHWGVEPSKVHPDAFASILGFRKVKENIVKSIIDLDLSFQALKRVVLYVKKVREEGGKILCIVDTSLPKSVRQLLKYTAMTCQFIVKTGKEAQNELSNNQSYSYAGMFIIGGYNSGRAMSIIAARKAGVPVISICDPSANLQGITYPVIVNTTSLESLSYVLELLTFSLRVKE